MYGEWEQAKDPKWRQISRYLEKSYPSDDVAAGNIDLEGLVDVKLPGIDHSIEVEPMIPPETPGREPMNEHEPTETPDRAQNDRMDEDDIAEVSALSESEDDAGDVGSDQPDDVQCDPLVEPPLLDPDRQ